MVLECGQADGRFDAYVDCMVTCIEQNCAYSEKMHASCYNERDKVLSDKLKFELNVSYMIHWRFI